MFEVGDLVLKRVFSLLGVVIPNWERPFMIKAKLGGGTFKLVTMKGTLVLRAWDNEIIF